MKNKISVIGQAILVVAAMFITACDDGQLRKESTSFSISPAAPTIISFYADPDEVKAGESTTISWEVAGADSIEITSTATDGSSPLHVETSDVKGSAVAKNLSATTDFTLTAKASAGPPEGEGDGAVAEPKTISISAFLPRDAAAGEADAGAEGDLAPADGATAAPPSSQTITVKVIEESKLSAKITADKGSLTPGESTIIRWTVSPEGASVEVTNSDAVAVEPTFAGKDCEAEDPQVLLDSGTPAEAPQANGCAVVTPEATTVYTVTAKADGASESADVEVSVEETEIVAEILVNGQKSPQLNNFSESVTVSWTAEPVGSLVTIVASPQVESCEPALPEGQAVEYSSAECYISGPTEFTIRVEIASDPSQYAEDYASVARGDAAADIDIRADEWAFVGEDVVIEITPKEGSDPSAIKEVRVKDADGLRTVAITELIHVKVPHEGVSVEMDDVAGATHNYGIRVRALSTISEQVDIKAEAITALAFDPNDVKTRYVGIQMPGWNKGVAYIYRDGGPISVGFGEKLMEADGLNKFWKDKKTGENEAFDKYIKTFPVNAIASRKDHPDEIYVGITGALMVTDDGGKTFELVAPARRISVNSGDYDGSHPTCRGQIQTGVKSTHDNQLVSLNQICDVVVTSGGRLILATDHGAFAISDITAFRAGKEDVKVVGHPSAKGKADEEGRLTYAHVVDDVECVDDECMKVYAATDRGVLVSENGGETWSEFGSIGSKAFKVVHLDDKLYAATDDGVYESDKTAASWTSIGLNKSAKSVAIDPNVNQFGHRMLIAGTDEGVFVTRDSGANWSPIADASDVESRDVAIATMDAKTGDGKIITVMLGSGKKVIYGQTLVGTIKPEATDAEVKEAMLKAGIEEEIVNSLK